MTNASLPITNGTPFGNWDVGVGFLAKMPDFAKLAERFGLRFNDLGLFEEALTHRSYLNEHPEWMRPHNERLEFLGDAVLELVVTEHLFRLYPRSSEGELTNLRAALVRAEMLSKIAQDLNVNEGLLLSRGEAKDVGRARDAILANTLEAIIGALYLDQGLVVAREFIERTVLSRLPQIIAEHRVRDAKSRFQETAQERLGVTPHYAVLEEWGPDHARQFRVGAYLGDELVGTGEGASKQEAQQRAAEDALRAKGWS
jgi:ribonuclease-3